MEMQCSVFQAQVMVGLTYCPGTAMELGARRGLRQELAVQLFTQQAPLSIQLDRGMVGITGDIQDAREFVVTVDLTREQLDLLIQSVGTKQWPAVLGDDLEEAIIGIQEYLQGQINDMQTLEMLERLPEGKRDAAMAKLKAKKDQQ